MNRRDCGKRVVSTSAAVAAVLALGTPHSVSGQQARCEDLALRALQIPSAKPDTVPSPLPYERLRVGEVPLGVGHVRPVDQGHVWGWHLRMRLPVFAVPGPSPGGWIADGWVVPGTGPVLPLGTAGMIETGYETPSFIVLERRLNGWLRMRYSTDGEDGGVVWTHECLFDLGPDQLMFEAWEDRLTSDDISPLFFISQVRHSLRLGPSVDSERIFVIPASAGEYEIAPLEVRGDWMRVRVSSPPTYCGDPDAPPPDEREGWVKWRDAAVGPWLWYFTRGC